MTSNRGEVTSSENPDRELVDFICENVAPLYEFNKSLVYNWQIELIDDSNDMTKISAIIEQDVILGIPSNPVPNCSEFETALDMIDDLNDEVYNVFKLIMLEVLMLISSVSYKTKIYLHRMKFHEFLMRNFLKLVNEGSTSNEKRGLINQYAKFIVFFLELGCSLEPIREYIIFLFKKQVEVEKRIVIIELLNAIFDSFSSHFDFYTFDPGYPIASPFIEGRSVSKSFSIQSWFKINRINSSSETIITLFTLASSKGNSVPTLSICIDSYNQVIVEVHNSSNGSRSRFPFNQKISIDQEYNSGFIFLTLTYDKYSNLNLFVDGEYSESIPASSIRKFASHWNKIYIGKYETDEEISDELLLRHTTVFGHNLSPEWICLYYNLGLGFDWESKSLTRDNIMNLLNHLGNRGIVNLEIKIRDLQSNKKFMGKKPSSVSNRSTTQYRNVNSSSTDRSRMVTILLEKQIEPNLILFDSDDRLNCIIEERADKVLYHRSMSIHNALYVTGGTSLLLQLIEMATDYKDSTLRDTALYKLLTFLFTILKNNWRLSKEFENINGYGILSIMLNKYKEKCNVSLTLNLLKDTLDDKSLKLKSNEDSNLLNLILNCNGYDNVNTHESIITNPVCYRFLVLNFKLFLESDLFELLLFHFQVLIEGSKYNEFNREELSKLKFMKKFIQFLKSPSLIDYNLTDSFENQIVSTLKTILRFESSVESIRSTSLYIVYALYNPDCADRVGILALQALTEVVCDGSSSIKILRKFSRSITIHWILLLFSIEGYKEVVINGMKLLTKLLKVLGSHIIKRFFHQNHGLDILTHFLKDWWREDEVVYQIFISAFSANIGKSDSKDLISLMNEGNIKNSQIVLPEFLILFNNMTLGAMHDLSTRYGRALGSNPSSPIRNSPEENLSFSLDVLHLINQYTECIRIGMANNAELSQFFTNKEWLDGAFELLGYLKMTITWLDSSVLEEFKESYENFVQLLSQLFIENLSGSFFIIYEQLNDLTKKLTLELVFPRIFDHINHFIDVSNFIFEEKTLLDSVFDLLYYYYENLFYQKYFIPEKNLDIIITCVFSILELNEGRQNKLKRLRNCLGDSIILKLLHLRDDGRFKYKYEKTVKLLLYRQLSILGHEALDNERLGKMVVILIAQFFQLEEDIDKEICENTFNFLRTCFMINPNYLDSAFAFESHEIRNDITFLLKEMTTKNDEDTMKLFQKYPTMVKSVLKCFHKILNEYENVDLLNVSDMINVTLRNGGKLGRMNSLYIKSFERDCEKLKQQVISGEVIKFNRFMQDTQENIQFFVSVYNTLKNDTVSLVSEGDLAKSYVLDFIENDDRMRARLIIEDRLPESERLSYNIEIPIKQELPDSSQSTDLSQYDMALSNAGVDTLSLSSTESFIDVMNDYEFVEEASNNPDGEVSNSYEDKNRKVIRSLYMGDQITALWNISQINGLEPIEGLMILGTTHLYLIENYLHSSDGNVIDAHDAPAELKDPYLQLINSQSTSLSKRDPRLHKNKNWSLDKLSCISKRQFLLRDIALEMFFSDGASILITCIVTKERDNIYNKLSSYASGKGLDYDLTRVLQLSSSLANVHTVGTGTSYITSRLASAFSTSSLSTLSGITKKWRMGEMSNFYYLMLINTLAGRTFNDLTQYPVFPWVIADYSSQSLDLTDPKSFRDLTKPMGGQTKSRANQFRERFEALESLNDPDSPPFHYGTHYSSAMIVTLFLIRLKPYVQSYLLLQGGKFDHADRLFNSISKAWSSASSDNTTDVRELTPEFFYLSQFLINHHNFELGTLQDGSVSNDVELPPWAKGDPKSFIAKNREALESPYVSANLHSWIELIFGHKQNGPEAVKSLNVFHHLSYNGAIDLDNISDEVEKRAVIGMINNFGQTPLKVFHKPHHKRDILNLGYSLLSLAHSREQPQLVFESKIKQPVKTLMFSKKTHQWVGRPMCVSAEDDLVIRKNLPFKYESRSLVVNQVRFLNVHVSDITSILQIGNKTFLSGSEDGLINIWKCNLNPSLNLQFVGILRGHFARIKDIVYSKSFKIGVSVDSDQRVIVWDLSRFKFIRSIAPPPRKSKDCEVFVAVSNDTGNIGIIYSDGSINEVRIFTVNGDLILTKLIEGPSVTCFSFGTVNESVAEPNNVLVFNDHSYWSKEIIAVGRQSIIELYELNFDEGWTLDRMNSSYSPDLDGAVVTALQVFKKNEVDIDDRLLRGYIKIVLGDSRGRVFMW